MKPYLFFFFLVSCATHPATAPSTSGVKASLRSATEAANKTTIYLHDIKAGADVVDSKATRALEYF